MGSHTPGNHHEHPARPRSPPVIAIDAHHRLLNDVPKLVEATVHVSPDGPAGDLQHALIDHQRRVVQGRTDTALTRTEHRGDFRAVETPRRRRG